HQSPAGAAGAVLSPVVRPAGAPARTAGRAARGHGSRPRPRWHGSRRRQRWHGSRRRRSLEPWRRACGGDDRRGLQLPAELGAPLPRPGGAGGGDGAGGSQGDHLSGNRRRHHRDPRGHRRAQEGMMRTVESTTASSAVDGVDGVEVIMRRGGAGLRERMIRTERHLERVTARAGAPLAVFASATIRAGGKRLRPLLVVLAAESAGGPPRTVEGEQRLVRAAAAVELVHSATLVHDDLIDGAQLRRGRPTVAAVAGRGGAVATGDLLFSLAFAELARNDSPMQLRALSDASSALAEG